MFSVRQSGGRPTSRRFPGRPPLTFQPGLNLLGVESDHTFKLQVGDYSPAHPLINCDPGNPHARGQFFRGDKITPA
jgi:hypothetical protein